MGGRYTRARQADKRSRKEIRKPKRRQQGIFCLMRPAYLMQGRCIPSGDSPFSVEIAGYLVQSQITPKTTLSPKFRPLVWPVFIIF